MTTYINLFKQLYNKRYTRDKNSIIRWGSIEYTKGKINVYMQSIDWKKFWNWGKDKINRWWYFKSISSEAYLANNQAPTVEEDAHFSRLCDWCMIPEYWDEQKHNCFEVWAYHPGANMLWVNNKYIAPSDDNETVLKNYCWIVGHCEKKKE